MKIISFWLFLGLYWHTVAMQADWAALVEANKIEELKEIVSTSTNPSLLLEWHDAKKNTLLHFARTLEMARFLLSHKISVNMRNIENQTPLHSIVWNKAAIDFELAALLLDHGADLAALDINKHNVAHLAASKSSEFIHRLFTHVPVCAMQSYAKKEAITFILCFTRGVGNPYRHAVARGVVLSIARYCLCPPFVFPPDHEFEIVKKVLFAKLDVVKQALETEDHRDMTPAFLEAKYWPEDRSKLLNPLTVTQYVPGILASIEQAVSLVHTYTYTNQTLMQIQKP